MDLVEKVKNLGRAAVMYAVLSGAPAMAEEMPYEKPDKTPKTEKPTESLPSENMPYKALGIGAVCAAGAFLFLYYIDPDFKKKE